MAKIKGKIGYAITAESTTESGVWEEVITERTYYGDVLRNSRRLQASNGINDNVVISNQVSIVADPFAYENFHSIRYVVFMGAKWKVTNIEVQRPRLIMTLGDVYNG